MNIKVHIYVFELVFCFLQIKMCYIIIYNGILLSNKKNEILTFAITCIVLENIMLSELSQTEKDKYSTVSLICGILKTDKTDKQKSTHRHRDQSDGCQRLGKWSNG